MSPVRSAFLLELISSGYYFVADDTVFNIWHDLPLEKYLNPIEIDYGKFWWVPEEIQRSFDAFEKYYKNDLRFGKSWQKYKNKVSCFFNGAENGFSSNKRFLTRM